MNFSCVKASERASVDVTAAHAIACQMRTFRLFEIRHLLSLAWGLLKENKNSKHECEQSLQKYPCLQFDLYFLVFNQGLRIWTYALACKCLSSNRDDTRVLAKIRVPWNNVTDASSTVRGRKGNDWDFLGRCPCSASNLLFWGWQHSSPLPGPVLLLSPGKIQSSGRGPKSHPAKLVAVLGRGRAAVVWAKGQFHPTVWALWQLSSNSEAVPAAVQENPLGFVLVFDLIM